MAARSCPTAPRATATTSAARTNSRCSPTSTRTIVDPKNFDPKSFVDVKGDVCIIPPNSFALARTVEYFRIPRNVLTICLGKSTYARCGIIVNVTPFEPEWEGYVTLEFSNTTPLPAKIYANEGVAQVLFFESDEVCETSYKDRGGKYQGQHGRDPARRSDASPRLSGDAKPSTQPLAPRRGIAVSRTEVRHEISAFPSSSSTKTSAPRMPAASAFARWPRRIEEEGMEVLGVTSYGDLSSFAQQQSRASAFILSIDDEEFGVGPKRRPPRR